MPDVILKATLNNAVPSSDTKSTCSWVCFFLDCDSCLLGTGRHEANAVGASSKSPLQNRGTPLPASLIVAAERTQLPPGSWAPSWQQSLQASNRQVWKAGPLALRRTSSIVCLIFRSSPGDQAEARLQLRLPPCLDFFPCSLRPPTLLSSWEQPNQSLSQKCLLGLWVYGTGPKTHGLNTSKGWWWASTVTVSLTPVHPYCSLARG